METSKEEKKIKPFKEIVSIKEIRFTCGKKGEMIPLLILNQTDKLKENGIDAIAIHDYTLLLNLNIGVRFKVSFDCELTPTIGDIIKPADKMLVIPSECQACGTKFNNKQPNPPRCSNRYCSGQARGFLYRLLKYAQPIAQQLTMDTYLDKYVQTDSMVCIDNLEDFNLVFFPSGKKDTQSRLFYWVKHHGEDMGMSLFKLDQKVEIYLNKDRFNANEFWSMCNFPNLQEQELFALSAISPQNVIDGKVRADFFLALPKRCQKLIHTNLDLILYLFNIIDHSKKGKKWVTLKGY